MTNQETSETVYNDTYYRTVEAQRFERAMAWGDWRYARTIIRAEVEADRQWSDLADTYRWVADEAMAQIWALDRAAHDAAVAALNNHVSRKYGLVETLKELAR